MVTMAGTTTVNENGTRKFVEAVWVPSSTPNVSAADLVKRDSLNTPLPLKYSASERERMRERDLEKGIVSMDDQPMSPRNSLRQSYMSAKKLNIPSVLAEDLDEESRAESDSSSASPSASGSRGNASTTTTSLTDEKASSADNLIPKQISGGGGSLEDDLEIRRIIQAV